MDAEELTHEVPFPLFLRGMFLAIGIFAIVLPAWELWRGVWPSNIFSPFFALIIAGAWSVGGAAVWAAVFGASATMVFRRGQLEVRELYLRSKRTRQFGLAEIGAETFDVEVGLNYAPLTGPASFLQRGEAESSQGSQDPAFQPIKIVKRTENVPVGSNYRL